MMKRFRSLYLFIYGILAMALLCTACSDDGDSNSVYPPVLTELVDMHVCTEGYIDYIATDAGDSFVTENRVKAEKLAVNALYRALCVYEKSVSSNATQGVRLYSVKLVMSDKPTPVAQVKGEIKTDPLNVRSVWRGGTYLNLALLPMAQSVSHTYDIIEESHVNEDSRQKLYLKLHHSQNGDYEAYEQTTYLSIQLKDYAMQPGDSIFITINTYKDGLKTWGVAY